MPGMKCAVAILVGSLMAACATAPSPPAVAPETTAADTTAADTTATPREPEPTEARDQNAIHLEDPPGGTTLRLPAPHTPRAAVLAAIEGVDAADWDDEAHERYRFHGWVRPLPRHCENGCTWWTYQFSGDALVSAELERSVYDNDAESAAGFMQEVEPVYQALTERLHAPPEIEHLAPWSRVESGRRGHALILERRTWRLPHLLVTATIEGVPGHHPGIVLRVYVEDPEPAS